MNQLNLNLRAGGSRATLPPVLDSTGINANIPYNNSKEVNLALFLNGVYRNRSFLKVIKTKGYYELFIAKVPFKLKGKSKYPYKKLFNYIDVGEYKARLINYDLDKKILYKSRENKSRTEEYKDRTIKRALDKIRRVYTANFQDNEVKHLTLTFRDGLDVDIKDIGECNKLFNSFAQRVKRKYGFFKYIKVAEFQKRGAVHFHVLCNLRFVPSKEIGKLWGYGFISINSVPFNIAGYISKYITKNISDNRFNRYRLYCYSRNLITPKKFYSSKASYVFKVFKYLNLKPKFCYSYNSAVNSVISVSEFDLSSIVDVELKSKLDYYLKGGD